jgi:hypothetical protein
LQRLWLRLQCQLLLKVWTLQGATTAAAAAAAAAAVTIQLLLARVGRQLNAGLLQPAANCM